MNYLFDNYQMGYLPGHTPDDNQNIIIICLIHPDAINEMSEEIILTSKIECVVQIMDKKLNEFKMGINSYDTNPNIFRHLVGLEFDTPLRFYRRLKSAYRIHKENEIHRSIQYDSTGQLIQKGTTYNGLFTGCSLNQDKKLINYRDGKIIQ